MGKSCCAINCKNRFTRTSDLSFHRLPKAKTRRSKWITAIRRKNWNPGTETWVCGNHFVSGKKNDDPLHPDYVPSLFSFTSASDRTRAVNYLERYLLCQEASRRRFDNTNREVAANALLNLQQILASEEPGSESLDDEAEVQTIKVKATEVQTTEVETTEVQTTQVQTEETHKDIAALHQQIKSLNTECQLLREKVYELQRELKYCALDTSEFDDSKIKLYTGLPNLQTFMSVFSFVSSVVPTAPKQSLKSTQELLLTLMKLRFNLPEEFLGYLFGIHQSTVSRIFRRWIHAMASRLHPLLLCPESEDLRRCCKTLHSQVMAAHSPPADGGGHNIQLGDYVYVKQDRKKNTLQPKWTGPFQVVLTTQTAVKCEDRPTWIPASDCVKLTPTPGRPCGLIPS
ncbi:uncharacterized protein ACJ7VT_000355 [Polymixia lowei]